MRAGISRPVSGHVFRLDRKRGPVWYAKYRLPDGRQVGLVVRFVGQRARVWCDQIMRLDAGEVDRPWLAAIATEASTTSCTTLVAGP